MNWTAARSARSSSTANTWCCWAARPRNWPGSPATSRRTVSRPCSVRTATAGWTATPPGTSSGVGSPRPRTWTPAANALLNARARALRKSESGDDAKDLRTELARLGVVVKDQDKKQYWRLAK
ncbi:CysS/YqeB C-terminal domain-containing protein [Amycolatopsis taiwanensis]|uniref:CysS/YqeB C-terminal domain-containing protein n=1 Tax=Amycolatopsis taiwanensis TaxID=342230 RepID=UPI003CCC1FC9